MRADDVRSRTVHQIPIVDPPPFFQIKPIHFGFQADIALMVTIDENQQGQQPRFIVGRIKQSFAICQAKLSELLGELASGRNHDAKKLVSLGVLTFASFEEASQKSCLARIRQQHQSRMNLPMIHRSFNENFSRS